MNKLISFQIGDKFTINSKEVVVVGFSTNMEPPYLVTNDENNNYLNVTEAMLVNK